MPIDSIFIDDLRSAIRTLLPEKAFLKTDRGSSLFVTNAPIFTRELPVISGFSAAHRGNLLFLSPNAELLIKFENSCSESGADLSRSLVRFKNTGTCSETLQLFSLGLKLTENCTAANVQMYDQAVRQCAAAGLRSGATQGIYACALLADILISKYTEDRNDT